MTLVEDVKMFQSRADKSLEFARRLNSVNVKVKAARE